MKDQAWFEMRDLRKRKLDTSVWIPLRAAKEGKIGEYGCLGYRSDFLGLGSIAVPVEQRAAAEALGYSDVGLGISHRGWVNEGRYVQADVFEREALTGLPLVLAQNGNDDEPSQWHLHQDLVATLGLKREKDAWVAINEGFIEVARFCSRNGKPARLEIRSEYLKDYLCARGMALYVSWYRDRHEVDQAADHITWPENPYREEDGLTRWEGRTKRIHEGGMIPGSSVAVMRVRRTEVDMEDEVPVIDPTGPNEVQQYTVAPKGRELTQVQGEIWRSEWVEPGASSPRVRGDRTPSSASFVIDAGGNRRNAGDLANASQWLWFDPGVIMRISHRRGGRLVWTARQMGRVGSSPNCKVVFGVNSLGLVNVYAKDIANLPEWQRLLWAGFSVSPEGGVSEELRSVQDIGKPASTQAPEVLFRQACETLNVVATKRLGGRLFRDHSEREEILSRVHRFRALSEHELRALAKDVARLTADSIDAKALQKHLASPERKGLGSLKTLEAVVALHSDKDTAHELLGPLFGVYDVRHCDAHLTRGDLAKAYTLLGVDSSRPFVVQACQMLDSCGRAMQAIADLLSTSPETTS